jgi:hypothetical protein
MLEQLPSIHSADPTLTAQLPQHEDKPLVRDSEINLGQFIIEAADVGQNNLQKEAAHWVPGGTGGQYSGAIESTESIQRTIRPIEFGDIRYLTDLPQGLDPFQERDEGSWRNGSPGLRDSLRPSVLDELPVGDSHIYYDWGPEAGVGQSGQTERTITVIATNKGKAISYSSIDSSDRTAHVSRDGEALMAELGYVVGEETGHKRVVAYPTPETVKAAAASFGIVIHEFPALGEIPPALFLQAYADGEYPISTGEHEYYLHDIEDGHLTALILGGEPLKRALKEAAHGALVKGDEESINKCTREIDNLTDFLESTLIDPLSFQASYLGMAQRLGISPISAQEILATAQANQRKFQTASN